MDDVQKRTWAEIDLSRLEHNYRALRALAGPKCKFLGVAKANAYGHGAVPVARKLEKLGCDYLAVACLDEAVELREAGVGTPILILGPTAPEYTGELLDRDLTQTVGDAETGLAFARGAEARGGTLKVHLKVDTGMSRLGFLCNEASMDASVADIARICALPGLRAEGIFTHFSDADGSEEYTMCQFTRFLDTLDKLAARGVRFEIRHCAASAAVLHYPCTHLDMVRPGVALYGHYPDPSCQGLDGPGLLPVMAFKTRVAAVRSLPANTPVSYGCTGHMGAEGGRVAVLPVGYADGLHRVLSNKGSAWLDGKARPILGRVCMDMCMVALDDDAQVEPGDEAEIFGPHLPAEDQAELAGTIQYELLCAVSPRVPRVYV